ncbi:MAG: hypothetical protein PVJ73_13300 [Acidobacteriota bacterium]|jgi:hypothetical protein
MRDARVWPAVVAASVLLVAPALAVAADVTGDWSYEVSDSWSKGPCPMGKGGSGKITMTQDGDKVTLVFVSGRKCSPASMCTFEGTRNGDELLLSNAAKVDDEGGEAKNEISLTFEGEDAARGTSESSYTHPGGMQCRWGSKLTLAR